MRSAVLLVAFGGPSCLDDVAPFMRSVMGVEPPVSALEAATRKYVAIGGCSPLPATAERIAAKLEHSLNGITRDAGAEPGTRSTRGVETAVSVGMLHSAPFIADAVSDLAARGTQHLVWASLSPFEATVTTGAFERAVADAARRHGIPEVSAAPSYHSSGPYVTFFAESLTAALAALEADRPLIVFTAHSLPATEASGGPYIRQLRETCEAVAARLGPESGAAGAPLPDVEAINGRAGAVPWLLAFQSRGLRGGDWLGPDLLGVVAMAARVGYDGVAVVPVGFAIDHMETLYDIDRVAAQAAQDARIRFSRARVPDDDPRMIDALARAARRVL